MKTTLSMACLETGSVSDNNETCAEQGRKVWNATFHGHFDSYHKHVVVINYINIINKFGSDISVHNKPLVSE